MRITVLSLSFVLLTIAAVSQESVSPSPNLSADSAPSPQDTMKFIQDGILGQHTYAGEYRAVQADATSCILSWTTVGIYDEKRRVFEQTEQKVSFNDIAKLAVTYDALAAEWNLELYAAAGKKITVYSFFNKKHPYPCENCKKTAERRFERSRWFIYFSSEEIANREAKAILRAAELCRGSVK